MTTGATGAKCEANTSAKSKLLIAGIVLAGVVLFALLFAALMFWRYDEPHALTITYSVLHPLPLVCSPIYLCKRALSLTGHTG